MQMVHSTPKDSDRFQTGSTYVTPDGHRAMVIAFRKRRDQKYSVIFEDPLPPKMKEHWQLLTYEQMREVFEGVGISGDLFNDEDQKTKGDS